MLALVLALASCSKCGGEEAPDAPANAEEPPAPAPAELLANVAVTTPNASWRELQRGVGGVVGILPSTLGGLASVGLGLDPRLGDLVDGRAPAFGALAGDPADPSWAFALKLVDPRRARSALVEGDTAAFSARARGGVTELVPKGGEAPAAALGLGARGYLLVARTPGDLTAIGAYAGRTLSRGPLDASHAVVVDVPREAIAKLIAPRLATVDAGVRAPIALADLEHVRLTLDVDDRGARLTATLTPRAGKAAFATRDGGASAVRAIKGALSFATNRPFDELPGAKLVTITTGRHGDDAFARADAPYEALREITRARAGF